MTATDEEILRKSGVDMLPPVVEESDEDEGDDEESEPAKQFTDSPGMSAERKAMMAAARAKKAAERRFKRDPVEAAKAELVKEAKKAPGGSRVPTAAQQQRAVAANLMPDAASYLVQKRQADGKLTYIIRYTQEELLKYGDPREFIRIHLVKTHGVGTYEVTETSKDGVTKAPVSFDIDPEGDEMQGQGAALAAQIQDLKAKLEQPKASPFDDLAAQALQNAMQPDSGINIDEIIKLQMLSKMNGPSGPDPALMMMLNSILAKLDKPAPMPMIPSTPAADPNAITVRDLFQMQDKMNERLAAQQTLTDAKFEKVMDKFASAIGDMKKSGDPLETALAHHERIESLKRKDKKESDDGIGNIDTLAKNIRGIIQELKTVAPGDVQAPPGAPPPGLAVMFPELPPKLAALVGAANPQARLEASYAVLEYLSAQSPEVAAEYRAFCIEAHDAHMAKLAGDQAAHAANMTSVRTRLARFHGELLTRGAIDKVTHDAAIQAWEPKLEQVCGEIAQLVAETRKQNGAPAQVQAPAPVVVVNKEPATPMSSANGASPLTTGAKA